MFGKNKEKVFGTDFTEKHGSSLFLQKRESLFWRPTSTGGGEQVTNNPFFIVIVGYSFMLGRVIP
jgi:hypothetical protein